jgi:hypothetical protein
VLSVVRPVQVELGASRGDQDGCRRYRPLQFNFDTRATLLDTVIEDDWDPAIKEQWRGNQSKVRMHLLAEHGTVDGDEKIENFRAMGPAPWSISYEHTEPLKQVRSAFAHGDFFPALVGACALGERIFNHLILALRDDYVNHRATTKRVRVHDTFDDWGHAVGVLSGWGVLTAEVAANYRKLEEQRHASIHFDPDVPATAREPALAAILAVQTIIASIFAPLGGPPTYISGTPGASFIARAAEETPLIKRLFIPRSALLSPAHRLYPSVDGNILATAIVDDADYDTTPLTDEEFAAALPAGTAAMHPEWTADERASS